MKAARLNKRTSVALDNYVVDCSWSSDSSAVAVAGGEGAVILVSDACTSPKLRTLGAHTHGTLAVAWQPGSAAIATSGQDGAVMLWDAATAAAPAILATGKSWTDHLAYAADGRLAAACGKTLTVWSRAGERLHEFTEHASSIAALAWDAAGRQLAAATHRAMWIHQVGAVPDSRAYKVESACLSAAFSPNGRVLASGMQDAAVHIWYRGTERDSHMRGYAARVALTHWSGNSRQLATASGSQLVVWDFGGKGPEGSRPLELSAHTDRIDCLAYQPTGPWLVSGGRDWRVALWLPGKTQQVPVDIHMTASEVSVLRWSPDGRFLAVGERGGVLSIYELATS